MEIKDVKVGDKVQLRKDIPDEELTELLDSHCLTTDNAFELQRRGEVTVRDIQSRDQHKHYDWDSITLVEMGFYWPIELFEPVNKPSTKSEKEQVQEDIQTVKDIIKRYGLSEQEGYAAGLVQLLTEYGEEFLARTKVESV